MSNPVSTFEYDNLIAGDNVYLVTDTRYPLAASQGDLKRGQALELNGSNEYIPLATAANFSAILSHDISDDAATQKVIVYNTGEFNENAVNFGAATLADTIEPARQLNVHFKKTSSNFKVDPT